MVMGAIMAAVAGIMVALSVDELMPLAKDRSAKQPELWRPVRDVGDGAESGGAPDDGHRLRHRNKTAH
jgi:hypothetical protein